MTELVQSEITFNWSKKIGFGGYIYSWSLAKYSLSSLMNDITVARQSKYIRSDKAIFQLDVNLVLLSNWRYSCFGPAVVAA